MLTRCLATWTSRRHARLFSVLLFAGMLLIGALIFRFRSSEAQGPQFAPLWPPFTMTYTVLDRDPSSGRVIADKTVQVVVESEHAWRGTTIRDGMNPKLVGSTQELRDGVVYSYEAEQRVNRQLSLNTKDAVTAITFPWLSPGFLPRAQGGAYPGWREVAALTPSRVAISSSETVPCPSVRPAAGLCAVAGLASVTREERIEYDPRSLTGKYIGGVAVFGEIRNNGQIIQSFRADSLEFR